MGLILGRWLVLELFIFWTIEESGIIIYLVLNRKSRIVFEKFIY